MEGKTDVSYVKEETFTIVMKAFLTSVSKNVVPFVGIIMMQSQSSSVNNFQSSSVSQPFGFCTMVTLIFSYWFDYCLFFLMFLVFQMNHLEIAS